MEFFNKFKGFFAQLSFVYGLNRVEEGNFRAIVCIPNVPTIERRHTHDSYGSIFQDISHVLSSLSVDDIISFFKSILFEDLIKNTIKAKFINLITSFKSIFKNLAEFIRSPLKTLSTLKSWFFDFVQQVKNKWNSLTKKEKHIFIIRALTFVVTASLGAYFGVQIPDKDITWFGIGSHRNFFTHSVGPALLVEFIYRAFRRLLYGFKERLPAHRVNYWSESIVHVDNCLKSLVLGFYAGITFHLGKDLFFDGSQSIRGPGFNTFVKNTYIDDNLYLGLQTILSTPSFESFKGNLP